MGVTHGLWELRTGVTGVIDENTVKKGYWSYHTGDTGHTGVTGVTQ